MSSSALAFPALRLVASVSAPQALASFSATTPMLEVAAVTSTFLPAALSGFSPACSRQPPIVRMPIQYAAPSASLNSSGTGASAA